MLAGALRLTTSIPGHSMRGGGCGERDVRMATCWARASCVRCVNARAGAPLARISPAHRTQAAEMVLHSRRGAFAAPRGRRVARPLRGEVAMYCWE